MANDILTLQSKLEIKSGEIRIDHRIVADGLGQKSAKSWRENILQKYEAELSGLGGILRMPLDDGSHDKMSRHTFVLQVQKHVREYCIKKQLAGFSASKRAALQ
jgi:hypothetical protein